MNCFHVSRNPLCEEATNILVDNCTEEARTLAITTCKQILHSQSHVECVTKYSCDPMEVYVVSTRASGDVRARVGVGVGVQGVGGGQCISVCECMYVCVQTVWGVGGGCGWVRSWRRLCLSWEEVFSLNIPCIHWPRILPYYASIPPSRGDRMRLTRR